MKATSRRGRKRVICALDTETTGFSSKDKILEFSAVVKDPYGHVHVYHSLINPHRSIGPYAQAVHGITQEDVRSAPSIEELRPEIRKIIDQVDVVAAHNMRFDDRMLLQEGIRIPEEKKACTMQLGKACGVDDGGDGKVSLDDLVEDLDIRILPEERHHAASDTVATLQAYEILSRRMK